jgi:hypothetical protein
MSVTSPEEYQAFIAQGAASVELKKPLAIPEPTPEVESIYRYCSDDAQCGHSDEAGCRRSETMVKWEAENGRLLPADLSWGARDLFFFFEDKIYYYKPFIEKILSDDITNNEEDSKTPEFANYISQLGSYADDLTADATKTLDDVRSVISAKPAGMLPFVTETENFFVFESPGTDLVTEITRDVLNAVQTSFTSDYRFAFSDPADALYIKDGKAYWTDLVRWINANSEMMKQGITFDNKFYPFGTLSSEARQIMTVVGEYYSKDYSTQFEIVELS